ncbi:MAG: Peptide chain release factor 2 [Alphaproteobacteria bacterium MarineAlpha11_Bin1]|nr:MAG: Peptide chain release factor 2 [Alphaproteobacteria bacterium MarineAlpha11_Bin1]|tara:strand:+ start:12862 stop:13833 length:972 start_codon:yes stop_codon:yes gene_type:complete
MRERNQVERSLQEYWSLVQDLNDTVELIEIAEVEGDREIINEAEETLHELQKSAAKQELQTLLSGEADSNDCFLEVHAGAGGTESQDWAQMLIRMYIRWSESHGCEVEVMEESPGEEAGLKSATIRIQGHNAYGWLKTESGVHRLVRISPYDSSARRHTSFASVWAYPEIDDDIEIAVDEKDLRIDTYRSQGAGGQHVNTTDSAIRITHIPSGIVVACQNDRSQHRNRAEAMRMLRARLYEAELQRREEAAQAEQDAKTEIGWGHQIRSYVLHPYQMVKDLRTEVETSNTQNVLDGDLDDFMAAALAQRVAGDGVEEDTGNST